MGSFNQKLCSTWCQGRDILTSLTVIERKIVFKQFEIVDSRKRTIGENMDTFCACCFFCSARANQQHLILSVYIVQLFLPLLRNSESGTIALSRERWKWTEFPEIQRVSFSPAQAMYKCIYLNCKNYNRDSNICTKYPRYRPAVSSSVQNILYT